MEKVKSNLETIVSKYSYKEGKRYTDYIKGDKVSEVGLTALIAGGAGAGAAKLGLFAKILLVFKKLWIFVLFGIGGIFKWIGRLFKRKQDKNESININSEEIAYKDNPNAESISKTSTVSAESQNEEHK